MPNKQLFVPVMRRKGRIPPLLLKPEEAAVAMGLSARMLWTLTKQGEVPYVKLGKLVRYSPEALRAWAVERSQLTDK